MVPHPVFAPVLALLILTACTSPSNTQGANPQANARNPAWPGATGSTVVVGSTSTIAGDADAAYIQQKWLTGRMR